MDVNFINVTTKFSSKSECNDLDFETDKYNDQLTECFNYCNEK